MHHYYWRFFFWSDRAELIITSCLILIINGSKDRILFFLGKCLGALVEELKKLKIALNFFFIEKMKNNSVEGTKTCSPFLTV